MTSKRSLLVGAAALALATSCRRAEAPHEHASAHPPGHDHHDERHGHGGDPMWRTTLWSERMELFAEHPAAIAGKAVPFLIHLTVLQGFHPLDDASVRLELEGPAAITANAEPSTRPGIFEVAFVPPQPGLYRGRVVIGGNASDSIEGLALEVFSSAELAAAAAPTEQEGIIELLKEQQWGIDFATAFARRGTLVASIEVAGTVDTPPGGSAEVGAPIAGRVVPPPRGLPRPGEPVRKGQVLATLAPAPSSAEEAARSTLALSEADARLVKARAAVRRAERLFRDQAISQREHEDAQREARVAEEAVAAARTAHRISSGATAGVGSGSWRLVAPISGILASVDATPGAAVAQGAVLFHIVDTRELWIRGRVPEQDAARLRPDRDASFRIAGLDEYLPLDITGADANASLVTIARTVDPTSRTVDVIYSLRKPDPRLRVGGLVRMSLPAGSDVGGIIIARSAVVEDDGKEVVYVQLDGEHFQERLIRSGPQHGDSVAVVSGLVGNERVVTRGANVVRLVARAGSGAPHGHIH